MSAIIYTGNVAETCGDVRNHNRKSLKNKTGNVLRRRAETPETLSQVIENKAETETETPPPLRGVRVHARTHTRPRVASGVPN